MTHAMAFVRWKVYRRSPDDHRSPPRFFYGSDKVRLPRLVGKGGTLWVVTGRRTAEGSRYSLAYKLVHCMERAPDAERRKYGRYMVQSADWRSCRYYSFKHDATDVLRALRFTTGTPLAGLPPGRIGMRLQSIPALTPDDVTLLERFEDKLLTHRKVFISYDHADRAYARRLEAALDQRNIQAWIDLKELRLGDEWEPALVNAASNTDCFVVLVSEASASSAWVRREVAWALEAKKQPSGLVKLIAPIVLPGGDLESFPGLREYQGRSWDGSDRFFDTVAADVERASSR